MTSYGVRLNKGVIVGWNYFYFSQFFFFFKFWMEQSWRMPLFLVFMLSQANYYQAVASQTDMRVTSTL